MAQHEEIKKELKKLRDKLLQTDARNRLIHVNREAKRANVLNIVDERADDTFRILCTGRKKMMRFGAKKEEKEEEGVQQAQLDDGVHFEPDAQEELDEKRHTDLILETPLPYDALHKRLLRLSREAKIAQEERGVNVLYLNIGFLKWYESNDSNVVRTSPLILIPVELIRSERGATFRIQQRRGEDIETNLPLKERLRREFDLELPQINDREDWKPSDYYSEVRETIKHQGRWSIDENGMQLGFFSFAKFLMLDDLRPEKWPNDALLNHPLVAGLLVDSFDAEQPLFEEDARIDDELEPAKLLHVIDADVSQTKVIQEALSGRNLVVQGPPGTGKSQTITNILAAAAHSGKKVLFVAEKMAALEVVKQRMEKAGLGDLCLELHSRTANKREFAEKLIEVLDKPVPTKPALGANELKSTRDRLNRISRMLHDPAIPHGRTPFEVLSKLIEMKGKKAPPPSINVEVRELTHLKPDEEREVQAEIKRYCALVEQFGSAATHPYRGSHNPDLQPTDLDRLANLLKEAVQKIGKLRKFDQQLAKELRTEGSNSIQQIQSETQEAYVLSNHPPDIEGALPVCHQHAKDKRFPEALEVGHSWASVRAHLEDTFIESAWSQPIQHLRKPLADGSLPPILEKYRSASKVLATLLKVELPKDPAERLELCDELQEAQMERTKFLEEQSELERHLQEVDNAWASLETRIEGTFTESALSQPIQHLRKPLADGSGSRISWILRIFGKYRSASKELATLLKIDLPRDPAERLALCDELQEAQMERTKFQEEQPNLKQRLQEVGNSLASLEARLEDTFIESAWSQPIQHLKKPLADGSLPIFEQYRSASQELATLLKMDLPKDPAERLALCDKLHEAQTKRKHFLDERPYLEQCLQEHWRGERTAFAPMLECSQWLTSNWSALANYSLGEISRLTSSKLLGEFSPEKLVRLLSELEKSISVISELLKHDTINLSALPEANLADLAEQLESMQQTHLYDGWKQFRDAERDLVKRGLEALIERAEQGTESDTLVIEFEYALYEERWKSILETLEISYIYNPDRHDLVRAFKYWDSKHIEDVKALIRAAHLSQIPRGHAGEMGILRGQARRKRGHSPIRKLMSDTGEKIQEIKPIFLMSPISVSQFLEPGKLEFDLLVIDEASQMRPEDSLGVVARAKQIVVVGDQKQLPPTSFFDRLAGNDDDEEDEVTTTRAGELESILSLGEVRGLGGRMLKCHYRSRNPSLITISNEEFYDSRLLLLPNAAEDDSDGLRTGLSFRRVDGAYSSRSSGGGRPGTNQIEAEAIATRLAELAKEHPGFSVGIATFSKAQADMVTEILELRRREDQRLDEFLRENKREHVFVKNIENVQGDERDIILISVGYGPHSPKGRLASMSFGPINSDGGERRLNVLFTRSRFACEVFASFDPGDIDLGRTTKTGPKVLKKFLEYAQSGQQSVEKLPTGESPDSPFEEDVARVIRVLGYEADHQVGTKQFKIDIGVRNSGDRSNYILAVECDGANYHSSLSARERDRWRQETLEGFGWQFHRIWSTDWYYRRSDEIKRLKEALDDAANHPPEPAAHGANANQPESSGEEEEEEEENESWEDEVERPSPSSKTIASEYRCWKGQITNAEDYDPAEVSTDWLAKYITRIVQLEGLIHYKVVASRYTEAFQKRRRGSRILRAVEDAVQQAVGEGLILCDKGFLGTKEQFDNPPIRNRSSEGPKNPEHIAAQEIRACAQALEKENGKMELDELTREIAKTLGLGKAGAIIKARIGAVLDSG